MMSRLGGGRNLPNTEVTRRFPLDGCMKMRKREKCMSFTYLFPLRSVVASPESDLIELIVPYFCST